MTAHELTICEKGDAEYAGRGGARSGYWKAAFTCPICNRQTKKMMLNYLGRRKMTCDGVRFAARAADRSAPRSDRGGK